MSGILAVLLGLKAAIIGAAFGNAYEDLLWAAAEIAIASGAGATMAVWRRREGWAFSASLGTNLAASLVVWYFYRNAGFGEWWLNLIEANVIASSTVALGMVGGAKTTLWTPRAGKGDRSNLCEAPGGPFRQIGPVPFFRGSPLLAAQIALPVVGMSTVLALPVAWLAIRPAYLPAWLAGLAERPAGSHCC